MSEKNITYLLPSQLIPHPKNKSLGFENYTGDKWQELLTSIQKDGILHPVIVQQKNEQDTDKFIIISGSQRVRAAIELQLDTVPCIITFANDIDAERQLIATNLIQRDYSYFNKLKLASRLLELSEDRRKFNGYKGGKNATIMILGQLPKIKNTRDIVASQAGLTDRDLKVLSSISKLPKEHQNAVWNFIESKNPNKTELKKQVASLLSENKKLKKKVGAGISISSQMKKLKKEQEKLRFLIQKNPSSIHIEQIYDAFQKAQIFMTSELSRIAHLPIPKEASQEEQVRLYARMLIAMMNEFSELIENKFLIEKEENNE